MPKMVLTGGQSGTLRSGLNDAFANAYGSQAPLVAEQLAPVMDLNVPTGGDREVFAYYKHAPYPRYWPRGQEVEKAGFEAVQFEVLNYDYGLEVEWHSDDEADDRIGMLRNRAANTGQNFAWNDSAAFFDLLLGTTAFLPGTVAAPDGATIYATTAGGAARFGATGGNLITSTGNNSFSSAAVLRADFWTAVERFRLFQNTESRRLFPDSVLNSGFVMYFGAGNEDVASEAFMQNPTAAGILTSTSNAGVQNIFMAAGKSIELRPVQEITDNDAFIFLKGVDYKPFFKQVRQPVSEQQFDQANSKESARTLLNSMIWHERAGYGVFLPYGTIKLNGT